MFSNSNKEIEIECPACKKKHRFSIKQMMSSTTITAPCGAKVDTTGFQKGIKSAEAGIDDFKKHIEKLNRR
jgi:hypothetical protein